MPNRTISLSPIGDLIRKKLLDTQNLSFSSWIEARLMEWNHESEPETEDDDVKTLVPWHYECRLCKQKGHHHSDCSMYNPEMVIE